MSDYKSGKSPAEGFEARALFQLRFYGLMIWRTRGVVPSVIRLVYLGDSQIVSYEPDETDLLATERKMQAIWAAILEARATGDYQPSPGRNCDWCAPPRAVPRVRWHASTDPAASTAHARGAAHALAATREAAASQTSSARDATVTSVSDAANVRRGLRAHVHVVLDDQDRAAGRLGRGGAGVGVLDGHALPRVEPERGRGGQVGLRVRLAARHLVAGHDHPEGLRRQRSHDRRHEPLVRHGDQAARDARLAEPGQQLDGAVAPGTASATWATTPSRRYSTTSSALISRPMTSRM